MRQNHLQLLALVSLVLFLASCSSSVQPPAAPAPTQPAPTAVPPTTVMPTAVPPTEPPPSPSPTPAATAPRPTSVIAASPTITEMVKLGDITMYYAAYGKGQPLLLLHGGMGSSDTFVKQVPAFAEKYQVITPDSRGQGRTTDSDAPLGYHLMAEDMVRLMDYLKIDKTAIVGWSDGGIIGLDMAINHPQRVRALVTYGANISPDGLTPWFLAYMKNSSTESLARDVGADYLRLFFHP